MRGLVSLLNNFFAEIPELNYFPLVPTMEKNYPIIGEWDKNKFGWGIRCRVCKQVVNKKELLTDKPVCTDCVKRLNWKIRPKPRRGPKRKGDIHV